METTKTIDELKEYREKLGKLTEEEKKQRDLYLKKLADGTLQGPPTGYSSIDKQWLKFHTDDAIKADVPNMKIYDYMFKCSKKYKNTIALEYCDIVKISYQQLYEKIEETAKALLSIGVKSGDIVTVCLPNMPEMAYVFYALNRIGAVANMVDPRANEPTLKESIISAESKLLISLNSVIPKFENIVDDTKVDKIVSISAVNSLPLFAQLVAKKKDNSLNIKTPSDERIINWKKFINGGKKYSGEIDAPYEKEKSAVIAYTGGSTGVPKGVITDDDNFNAMVKMHQIEGLDFKPGDISLDIAPPWTYYGLSNAFNVHLCLGLKIILVPVLGPDDLDKLVVKYKPAHIMSVPSCLVSWIKGSTMQEEDLSYLKSIVVGADKMNESFEVEFNEFLKERGCNAKVTKGYGMTEVTSAATYTKDNSNRIGSIGIPFALNNVSMFDPETQKEVLTGEKGEICIQTPTMMKGYFGNNSSATKDVIKKHDDGTIWAHTNDIGHMDEDGRIYHDGRIKRMIIKKGFKIFASEVENAIASHPEIENVAVVGVPDEMSGSLAKAYIVIKNGYKERTDEIKNEVIKLCEDKLYDYEIPDFFDFRDSLPLTAMGKIDFKKLETEECVVKNKTR